MNLKEVYKNFNQERVVGEHNIYLPDPPNFKDIHYKDLSQEKQFFRRTFLPENWKSLPKAERDEFANEQWDIRGREGEKGKGFWFFNNGNLEYMSPNHYFYANWWRIGKTPTPKDYCSDPKDIFFPFFTDGDRDKFYFLDDCFESQSCAGVFTIEPRRFGKTYVAASYQYEKVSKNHESYGGTQSRDDTDSYNVFSKVVFGWRHLPPFFKPVDTGNNNPQTDLVFDEPQKINKKDFDKDYSDVLHSWIDYGNASKGLYDGKEQIINIQDEIGKIEKKRGVDLEARIEVVVECCFKFGEKIGMVIATTTVEEMEKSGGDQAQKLWIQSTTLDVEAKLYPKIFAEGKALSDEGLTTSKLKRWFRPAFKGYLGKNGKDDKAVMLVDRYGYSNEELGREYFVKRRANLKGAKLASEKRKFPITINDCWVSDTRNAAYNIDRLDQQMAHNQTLLPRDKGRRGNFIWKDGIEDGEVVFVDNSEGKWIVSWRPDPTIRNKYTLRGSFKTPSNTDLGCFGLDPYDNKATTDKNNKSNAASYGVRKYDPMQHEWTGIPICEYVERPPLPEIMWEDMILQSVYYGWEILIESNKIGTINHFRRRGYINYLMKRPEETQTEYSKKMEEPGIPMSGDEARLALMYAIESFVETKVGLIEEEGREPRMGNVPFDRLLRQLADFVIGDDWTKYDSMVGLGLALLGNRKFIMKKKPYKSKWNTPKFQRQGDHFVLKTKSPPIPKTKN